MYYVWKYKKYLGNNRSYVKGMADVKTDKTQIIAVIAPEI